MSDDPKNTTRRDFLKTGAAAGVGTALAGLALAAPSEARAGEARSQFHLYNQKSGDILSYSQFNILSLFFQYSFTKN